MTNEQRKKIEQHGKKLLAIFPNATERDPMKLCKKLRRIELRANRAAAAACTHQEGADAWRSELAWADKALERLLNPGNILVFVNSDPRGYALKIHYEHAIDLDIPRDWGGYGIIAPDLT